jgi:glycosyltransferase involved in cell wall biosynthesis
MSQIRIVIPTCRRSKLLERTLTSLAGCEIPEEVTGVTVVENGPKFDAEETCRRFSCQLEIEYIHSSVANKSHALNEVLQRVPEAYLVFFDDDVRIESGTLNAYAEEVRGVTCGRFNCGRVEADYEVAPPEWLLPFLPKSAKGWKWSEDRSQMSKAQGLGANWGAFVCDLKAAGGFDISRGPGTGSRGQETSMQQSLLDRGITGFYLPDAVVAHYVPADSCSPDWCLRRAYEDWVGRGRGLRDQPASIRRRAIVRARFEILKLSLLSKVASKRWGEDRRFEYEFHIKRHRGLLDGIGAALEAGKC